MGFFQHVFQNATGEFSQQQIFSPLSIWWDANRFLLGKKYRNAVDFSSVQLERVSFPTIWLLIWKIITSQSNSTICASNVIVYVFCAKSIPLRIRGQLREWILWKHVSSNCHGVDPSIAHALSQPKVCSPGSKVFWEWENSIQRIWISKEMV